MTVLALAARRSSTRRDQGGLAEPLEEQRPIVGDRRFRCDDNASRRRRFFRSSRHVVVSGSRSSPGRAAPAESSAKPPCRDASTSAGSRPGVGQLLWRGRSHTRIVRKLLTATMFAAVAPLACNGDNDAETATTVASRASSASCLLTEPDTAALVKWTVNAGDAIGKITVAHDNTAGMNVEQAVTRSPGSSPRRRCRLYGTGDQAVSLTGWLDGDTPSPSPGRSGSPTEPTR